MYALQDAGLATNVLPVSQPNTASADQLEQRAVESSERGALTTEERNRRHYDPSWAVPELVERSAQRFARISAQPETEAAEKTASASSSSGGVGSLVDLYG